MEAEAVDELPVGPGWLYEPKYDGFRCLVFRGAGSVDLQSKKQRPLARYFPELAEGLATLRATDFVLDGEIVIPGHAFETLQLRLHPATSRIAALARSHPARLIAFDLLADDRHGLLWRAPLSERRAALEDFLQKHPSPVLQLSRATRSVETARGWLARSAGRLEGIVAKRIELPYQPGERVMAKFKIWKTIDCVVAGLYLNEAGKIDSILLGLFDEGGSLNYVGKVRIHQATPKVESLRKLIGGSGFTGRRPGGKSRWSGKERKPVALIPSTVVEVSADHITGEYMRHGARLLRWREDKSPESCGMDQIR